MGLAPEVIELKGQAHNCADPVRMVLSLYDLRVLSDYRDLAACLHPGEVPYYQRLKVERRRQSYLLGRYTAKKALTAYGGGGDPTQILIGYGHFGQPVVRCDWLRNAEVSITHADSVAAALAGAEGCQAGIDIEPVDPGRLDLLRVQATAAELAMLRSVPLAEAPALTLLWTAKEALAKALKIGFTVPMELFEVERVDVQGDQIACAFRQFPVFRAISYRLAGFMLSLVVPRHMEIDMDWTALRRWHLELS